MEVLKEVACGRTVTVQKIVGQGAVKRRIMDMGITKGTEIYVRKVAPLGIPWRLRFADMNYPCVKLMPK